MSQNYFTVERSVSGKYLEHISLLDNDGEIESDFEELKNMSYTEMRDYKHLGSFVTVIMDAANDYFGESEEQTILTLIGEDDVFIWSIIMGPGEDSGYIRYVLVDWSKDGRKYRYEK